MQSSLNAADLREALLFIADEICREEPHLNALDSAIGDGDHGITMRLGFTAVRERLPQLDSLATLPVVLEESGQAFMGVTGGAIGIILGKMLLSGGAALRGAVELGTPEFKRLLTAMELAVSAGGKVKPGDKTILDAIHAAAEAVDPAQDLGTAVSGAAEAAALAAQNTAQMICRIGRASRLGARTLGHPDPGAVSFSIILRAWAQYVSSRR